MSATLKPKVLFIGFGHLAKSLLSKKLLKPNGALLIKSFNNSNLLYLKKEFKKLFSSVHIEKPLASKTSSQEVYLLGLVLK